MPWVNRERIRDFLDRIWLIGLQVIDRAEKVSAALPSPRGHLDLEPGSLAGGSGFPDTYPGEFQDLADQVEAIAMIFPKTRFKNFLFILGGNTG